jgi:hypothetical protein
VHSLADTKSLIPLLEKLDPAPKIERPLTPPGTSYLSKLGFTAPILSPPSSPKSVYQESSRKRTFESLDMIIREGLSTQLGSKVHSKLPGTNVFDPALINQYAFKQYPRAKIPIDRSLAALPTLPNNVMKVASKREAIESTEKVEAVSNKRLMLEEITKLNPARINYGDYAFTLGGPGGKHKPIARRRSPTKNSFNSLPPPKLKPGHQSKRLKKILPKPETKLGVAEPLSEHTMVIKSTRSC